MWWLVKSFVDMCTYILMKALGYVQCKIHAAKMMLKIYVRLNKIWISTLKERKHGITYGFIVFLKIVDMHKGLLTWNMTWIYTNSVKYFLRFFSTNSVWQFMQFFLYLLKSNTGKGHKQTLATHQRFIQFIRKTAGKWK